MVCGNFILPEPASYVFFYAVFNLRKLLYIIEAERERLKLEIEATLAESTLERRKTA